LNALEKRFPFEKKDFFNIGILYTKIGETAKGEDYFNKYLNEKNLNLLFFAGFAFDFLEIFFFFPIIPPSRLPQELSAFQSLFQYPLALALQGSNFAIPSLSEARP